MEEFVQDFKRVARESRYERHPLIEEFKQGINRSIRRKLMEAENQPSSMEQWYRRTIALDRNWRESKREEERLREKKDQWSTSFKVEPVEGIETDIVMTTSVAEEARNTILVGDNRTCSDGESREDKCSDSKALVARGRVSS